MDTTAKSLRTSHKRGALPLLLAILFFPLLGVAVVLLLVAWLAHFVCVHICLHMVVWIWWCPRGRDVLFVYSDSPIWHEYLEEHLLPHLAHRAVVLNWSQRKWWKPSIATIAFHHFGGDREYNPLVVVFRPFRRSRTFRFWKPFRDFKHGNSELLHRMQSDLLGLIGAQSVPRI